MFPIDIAVLRFIEDNDDNTRPSNSLYDIEVSIMSSNSDLSEGKFQEKKKKLKFWIF